MRCYRAFALISSAGLSAIKRPGTAAAGEARSASSDCPGCGQTLRITVTRGHGGQDV